MVDRSAKRRMTTDRGLGTPADLGLQCHERYHCGIKCAPGRRFHALHKEHEHPLACQSNYHPLFEEHAIEIIAMTGEVERVRKVGGPRFAWSAISRVINPWKKEAPLHRFTCQAGRTVRRHKRFTASA
jgi:hypothetical protein